MIARACALALLLLGPALPAVAEQRAARAVYIGVEGDPAYQPQPSYTGLSLKDRSRPVDGARLAIKGAKIMGRAAGVDFALDEVLLDPGADAAAAVHQAVEGGALAVILDLPDAAFAQVVAAEGARGTLLNIRQTDDRWRGADCAPALLHVIPSRAMLADALAQHLRARAWSRALLLRGPTPEDAADAGAAARAATKFGLSVVATREFLRTNDPRQRDRANTLLLTGRPDHDVIWLIDSEGEFARYVPYATVMPRPAVGAEGLTPLAWHWTWERHGAPQLNQRFRKLTGRDMTSGDWAAWAAMRAVVDAGIDAGAQGEITPETVGATLRRADFAIDLYKGVRGGFRPWDGQLRQPILLATHDAVIARAPLDGFEHRFDTLDTLGVDQPETACKR